MLKVRVCEELEECSRIWAKAWPQASFFDLWPVRECFAKYFDRQPYFLVAEQSGKIEGLMALSWIENAQYWGHFPGETYQGKTWLEQNRIPVRSSKALAMLFDNIPGHVHLRYLAGESMLMDMSPIAVDEVGYLFLPGRYNFDFQNYMQSFSGKSRKKLAREIAELGKTGVSYRYDKYSDIQQLFQMNLNSFGYTSYFYDSRFLSSFEKLVDWLYQNDMLRVTTIMLGGRVAAIDIGALWGNSYTLLAGATHPDFPGVAKMINFHHMEWACGQRLDVVDFLCGDFGWKKRFHLNGIPLYEIKRKPEINNIQKVSPYIYANE